jgi:serine/threonine kinase PknH
VRQRCARSAGKLPHSESSFAGGLTNRQCGLASIASILTVGANAVEGTPFGRYRLVELLGRGGMGEVWRAHDTVTDRVVAIKVLPANLSKDGDFQQRFRREAHAAARLETPHVVPIYDYGEIDGQLFVSMRLIKGRDLAIALADGPLEPARAVRIITQVAEALHAAHEIGLIHRDIKPSNILLDDRDFAYLIDFGIARTLGETRMTQTGSAIGTFHYIAPERLAIGPDEDARADIYSLACVLYECLTGGPPFPGDTMPQLVVAHLSAPPPRPSASRPLVPAPVDEVIARGMAKDPNQRYATTIELADAAREAVTVPVPKPTSAPAQPLTEPAPRPASVRQQPAYLTLDATQHRPPVPQSRPADQPGPWPGQYPPARQPGARADPNRRLVLGVAAAVLILVITIVAAGIYFATKNSNPVATTTTAPTTTAPNISTSTGSSPVAEAALEGLLLTTDQINTAMNTSGMESKGVVSKLFSGNETVLTPANIDCKPIAYAAQDTAYNGSGWTAMRGQYLRSSGSNFTQLVGQNVVAFSSAEAATAFYAASSRSWSACANARYTNKHPESSAMWSTGPISDRNGWLTISGTEDDNPAWTLQRALSVRNNVVIDVAAHSYSPSSQLAVNIAKQIAAKVPA